jgi:hypothetical protein
VDTNVDTHGETTKKEPLSKKARKEKASRTDGFCEKKKAKHKLSGRDDQSITYSSGSQTFLVRGAL